MLCVVAVDPAALLPDPVGGLGDPELKVGGVRNGQRSWRKGLLGRRGGDGGILRSGQEGDLPGAGHGLLLHFKGPRDYPDRRGTSNTLQPRKDAGKTALPLAEFKIS